MRAAGLMILFVAACGGSGSGSPGDNTGAGGNTGGNVVTINWTLGAQSNPVTTTVAAGTPVRWQSGDGLAHTVNPDANPPPSAAGVPGGGVTATQTIATPGSY